MKYQDFKSELTEEIEYKRSGDLKFYLYLFSPDSNSATSPCVIFFCGIGSGPEQFSPQCFALAEVGILGISVD